MGWDANGWGRPNGAGPPAALGPDEKPMRSAARYQVSVDTLVRGLDAKCAEAGERWDIHRTVAQEWVVTRCLATLGARDDPASRTFRDISMEKALRAATDSRRLPVLPREPLLPEAMEVRKHEAGSRKWWVYVGGRAHRGHETKKAAEAYIATVQERAEKARDAWLSEVWPQVEGKTEGVDFYWAR
jgi:hypothetical protein